MKQYLDLLSTINEKGTYKQQARENMPTTKSIFGYQFRHDLSKGFPLLTTKKLSFKNIVVELLWFLRGDTHIKFLMDNGCNIWNEDAYSYYIKKCKEQGMTRSLTFDQFVDYIKSAESMEKLEKESKINAIQGKHVRLIPDNYIIGDCGKQYGWLWRHWQQPDYWMNGTRPMIVANKKDQIVELIQGLITSPFGRRHILTAWNPITLNDMALNACHALAQFNVRPLSTEDRWELWHKYGKHLSEQKTTDDVELNRICDENNIPKYVLDCQLYQRSADTILGVPYNIASYALLTHLIAFYTNMIAGDFIHTFGDAHIYSNHQEAVDTQLKRTPTDLPELKISDDVLATIMLEDDITKPEAIERFINSLEVEDFGILNYNPQSHIKAELSTGIKK